MIFSNDCVAITPRDQSVAVMKALQPMIPSLRKVELLTFESNQVPLPDGLSQLTRLVVKPYSYTTEAVDGPVWKHLIGIIERSSETLKDLALAIQPQSRDNPNQSVQDVLNTRPGSSSFPQLRSLSLPVNLGMRSQSTTLPQVPSLQSLSLPVDYRECYKGRDNIFAALRQSGILLQKVAAPGSVPLLDYLTSYQSILQEVTIEDSSDETSDPKESPAHLSSRFFRNVIPKHQSSLRKIRIDASYDDGWVFGDSNTYMFLDPLPALESLNIALTVTGEKNHLVGARAPFTCALILTQCPRNNS
jgi:hypothetical protein